MRTNKLIGTMIGAAVLTLAAAAPTFAASGSGPTGTIELQTADLLALSATEAPAAQHRYGDSVAFRTSVSGRVSSQATVYVTVVCFQDGNLVYVSSGDPGGDFPLEDQLVGGPEWNSSTAASCEGLLMYRVQKGKSFEFTTLAVTAFEVEAAA